MDSTFIRDRIAELRKESGLSEYELSVGLGHSRGYINNISSGKTLPSMNEFFAICKFFQITPEEFFKEKVECPALVHNIYKSLQLLDENDCKLVKKLVDRLKRH